MRAKIKVNGNGYHAARRPAAPAPPPPSIPERRPSWKDRLREEYPLWVMAVRTVFGRCFPRPPGSRWTVFRVYVRALLLVVLFMAGMFLSSCATIMNPYNEDFSCPDTDNGKCVGVPEAYDESANRPCLECDAGEGDVSPARAEYMESLYERLREGISEPAPPAMTAPKVLRVLLLPYEGSGGALYEARYVFMMVDSPRWIMAPPPGSIAGEAP
ncbi:MAG: TraV family lipoprotein [Candidatus Nitrospinota bacterium M3_3B_026]